MNVLFLEGYAACSKRKPPPRTGPPQEKTVTGDEQGAREETKLPSLPGAQARTWTKGSGQGGGSPLD